MENFIKGNIYHAVIESNDSLIYVLCTKNSNSNTFEGVCLHEGFHEKEKYPKSLNKVGDYFKHWDGDIFTPCDFDFTSLLD